MDPVDRMIEEELRRLRALQNRCIAVQLQGHRLLLAGELAKRRNT